MSFTPQSPRIVGDNTLLYGTGVDVYTGIIESASRKLGGDILALKDNNGFEYCVVYFNEKKECEVNVLLRTGDALPARGDNVTIGGVADCLVDSVETKWANADATKVTIQATWRANVDTTQDSASS